MSREGVLTPLCQLRFKQKYGGQNLKARKEVTILKGFFSLRLF